MENKEFNQSNPVPNRRNARISLEKFNHKIKSSQNSLQEMCDIYGDISLENRILYTPLIDKADTINSLFGKHDVENKIS
jgi:hypothetical protein